MFDIIADYYELIAKPAVKLEREGLFLLDIYHSCPASSVLDLACATGLHSRFLAEHGATVTGIDFSQSMIAYAEAHHAHTRVNYIVADMCTPPSGEFGCVLCLGNAISLLEDTLAVKRFFAAVSARLVTGGQLLVHSLNYDAPVNQQNRHRIAQGIVQEAPAVVVKNLLYTPDQTLLSFTCFSQRGEKWLSAAETAVLQHYSLEQLQAAAELAGLTLKAVYGDYTGALFEKENSQDLLLLCQR